MTKHLFELLTLAAFVAIVTLPGPRIEYTAAPRVAEAHQEDHRVDLPPAEALAVVYGPGETVPRPHELVRAEVSGYTSSADETDDTPNINAAGKTPGPGSIACPTRYKFGTRVFIDGDEFVCDDRMNPRYANSNHFDIWFSSKAEAIHWGRRMVDAEVVQ